MEENNIQQPSQEETAVPTPQPVEEPFVQEPASTPAPIETPAAETPVPTPQPVSTPAATTEPVTASVAQPAAPVPTEQPTVQQPVAQPSASVEESVFQPPSMTPQQEVKTEVTIKPGDPIAAKEPVTPVISNTSASIPDCIEPKKKKSPILLIAVLLLVGAGGYFGYNKFFNKPAQVAAPVNAVEPQNTQKYDYKIEKNANGLEVITINNEQLDIKGDKIEVKELDKGFFILAYNGDYISDIILVTKTYRKYTIDPDDILPINYANLLIKEFSAEEKDNLIYASFKREMSVSPKWYCSYEELDISEEELVEFTISIELTENGSLERKKLIEDSLVTVQDIYNNNECNDEDLIDIEKPEEPEPDLPSEDEDEEEEDITRDDILEFVEGEMSELELKDEDNIKSFKFGEVIYVGKLDINRYYTVDITYECKDGGYECVYLEQFVEKPTSKIVTISYVVQYNEEEKEFTLTSGVSFAIDSTLPEFEKINKELK